MSAALPDPDARTRRASFASTPSTWNPETRTLEVIAATETPVWRGGDGFFEILKVSAATIDTTRLTGMAIHRDHRFTTDDQIGVVEAWRIRDAQLILTIRLSERPEVAGVVNDIIAGIIRHVSVGYQVLDRAELPPFEGRPAIAVTLWRPFEASFVSVPADPASKVRSESMSDTDTDENRETRQNDATLSDEEKYRKRQLRALTVARCYHQTIEQMDAALRRYRNIDDWAASLQDALVRRDEETYVSSRHDAGFFGQRTDNGRSEAIIGAIAHRLNPELNLTAQAREYRGLSLLDIARDCLEHSGQRGMFRMAPDKVFDLATRDIGPGHGTGDFPYLLNMAGQRVVLAAYERATSPLKALARERSANDFKALTVLRMGEHPNLQEVSEHGEIKSVAIGEAKEAYRVKTYANILTITRQALINDDLGAFAQFSQIQGTAAAETETQLLVDLLVSNPTMDDTKALFHADHGNLAGSGGAISESTLSAARIAMRTQKGVGGSRLAPTVPRTLVVSPAKETEAEKQLTALNAAQSSNVNPFAGKLELAVEPRLSGNAWYVFAEPGTATALEYAYLQGNAGPQLSVREGWRTLGTEFRVVHDFGCGAVDWRGVYKNPGA